ncbi:uncharacterized protein LOC129291572 isoform X2 [Prosopis cineraria]|uniref:uncharacterized protein LOC129291572 isoform X2 n=1 Tax=Prosopis cineraria TaxID=364024 RepID=UPI00240F2EC4|nr:uncharacterized protein LOC129291572 isoform X2 [Prosopis cineraria]
MWSSGHINVDGIVPPSSFFLIGILFRPKSFSPQNPISFPSSVALLSRSSFRLSAVAVDCCSQSSTSVSVIRSFVRRLLHPASSSLLSLSSLCCIKIGSIFQRKSEESIVDCYHLSYGAQASFLRRLKGRSKK